MARTVLCALLLCLSLAGVYCFPEVIKVAVLIGRNDDVLEHMLLRAVDSVNVGKTVLPESKLSLLVEHLHEDESLDTYSKVCKLLENKVVALIGPNLAGQDSLVASISAALHVPHFQTTWHHDLDVRPFSLGLSPSPTILAGAFKDFILRKDWLFLVYIYEGNEALVRLQELEKDVNIMDRTIIPFDIKADYDDDDDAYGMREKEKDVWDLIKETRHRNFIIDVEKNHIRDVLLKAKDAGLMTDLHSYLITSLDFHTVNTKGLLREESTIYSFSLVDHQSSDFKDRAGLFAEAHPALTQNSEEKETKLVLGYDAVGVLAEALHKIWAAGEGLDLNNVTCDDSSFLAVGQKLLDTIKSSTYEKFTGPVEFDEDGMRKVDSMDLWRLQAGRKEVVAEWTPELGLNFTHDPSDDDGVDGDDGDIEDSSLENRTIVITTVTSPPFVMLKDDGNTYEGNDRFEGFCVELIKKLSEMMHFEYEIRLVDDGQFGAEVQPGKWTGMIGEVVEGRADMAVAPLTMTSRRLSAVEFTVPFMKTGIGLLYNREDETVVHTFFSPFTAAMWVYVVVSILVATALICLIGRITPFQWDYVSDTRMDTDFTVGNTFWFLFSALMFQRMTLTPRSLSTVVAFLTWWVFCIVIIVSYATVLGELLIRYKDRPTLDDVEDLVKQNQIKYGTLRGGSTQSFFEKSTFPLYMELWQGMQRHGDAAFVDSYEKGIERVIKSDYAMFMESPILKYVESRYCDVKHVGHIIGSSGYAIAVPQGAQYLSDLSASIIKLKYDGTLQLLAQYWWESHNVANCPPDEHIYRPTPFTVRFGRLNLVFIFLLLGLIITMVITLVNFARKHTKKTLASGTSESPVTIWNTLLEQLRAAVTCKSPTKGDTEAPSAEDGTVQPPQQQQTSPA